MSIRLHSKHGLNPTMTKCFFCGESKDILLVGSKVTQFRNAGVPVSSDGKMPMNIGAVGYEPCQKCKKYMDMGVILISVKDGEEGKNPYRTGGWVVVKDDYISKVFDTHISQDILKNRVAFIPDESWDRLGLPRGK